MKIHKTIIFKYKPRLISLYFLKNRTLLIYAIHLFGGGCTSWSYIIFYRASAYALHGITVEGGGGVKIAKKSVTKYLKGPKFI